MDYHVHLSEDVLNALLDEALTAEALAAAQVHLHACPECSARLHSLQAVWLALETLPDLPLGRDLSAGVLAALPSRASIAPPARSVPLAPQRSSAPYLSPAQRWGLALQALAALLMWALAGPLLTQWAAQLSPLFSTAALRLQFEGAALAARLELPDWPALDVELAAWLAWAQTQLADLPARFSQTDGLRWIDSAWGTGWQPALSASGIEITLLLAASLALAWWGNRWLLRPQTQNKISRNGGLYV